MEHDRPSTAAPTISRRTALAAAGACFAMMDRQAWAAADSGRADASDLPVPGRKPTYFKDAAATGLVEITGIHEGKGKGRAKFFRFGGASAPSAPSFMMIYDLPPGASEGVHTHFLDNRNNEGSFDEYYYVLSGEGQMAIDGDLVPIVAGDHVHTPLEVAHGVENTHPTQNLRIFLTYIKRGNEAFPPPRAAPKRPLP